MLSSFPLYFLVNIYITKLARRERKKGDKIEEAQRRRRRKMMMMTICQGIRSMTYSGKPAERMTMK